MDLAKQQILDSLNLGLERGASKIILVFKAPEQMNYFHGIPRLIVKLKGKLRYSYYKDTKIITENIPDNTWFYCSANGYLLGEGNAAGECISVDYHGNYMRAMHVIFEDDSIRASEKSIFYHSEHGLSSPGLKLIATLDELGSLNIQTGASEYLLKALLKITIENILQSPESRNQRLTSANWLAVNNYLHAHFTEALTRKAVANHFNLSPSYISHLFQIFGHRCFSNTILQMRLEYASQLLRDSNMTVDEISFKCGFNYSSYFVRRFKMRFAQTPTTYRKLICKSFLEKSKNF